MRLIFVGPLIVPEYPAALQSTGRYLALGLIALPLAPARSYAVYASSTARDWMTRAGATMMGNLILRLRRAPFQRTGAPVSTMIIGTLPVVIPSLRTCCTASAMASWHGQKWCPRLHGRRAGLCEYCRASPRAR